MAALPPNTSQEDFYNDESLHGKYQFVTLADIVNNFQLMYMGDGMIIPSHINRDIIIFHAKRGIQELNFDVMKQIKAIELEIDPDTLQVILPEDYIKYVRVSWVDDAGYFHPMITNDDTIIAEAYLQDNDYDLLFDESGNVLKAEQNTYDQTLINENYTVYRFFNNAEANGNDVDLDYGNARYGMQTDKANYNGWFTVSRESGVMKFSSNVGAKTVVIEYISDGLESSSLSDIKVHKFAEQALYAHIEYAIVSTLSEVREYQVRRKQKEAYVQKMKAKTRLNGLTYDDLLQILRGRDKRIK